MYCQNCGKENCNDNQFCFQCGAPLNQNSLVTTTRKAPLMEITSFSVHPSRESETIEMYQKMGWLLKSSQEINTSTTYVHGQAGYVNSYVDKKHYVKLTFERDKNMPNYNILKEKYNHFSALVNQIENLKSSTNKIKITYFILPIITSIGVYLAFFKNEIYEKDFFGRVEGIDWFLLILSIVLCLAVAVTVFAFEMAISTAICQRKIKPQIDAIYRQMESVADDAEKYL